MKTYTCPTCGGSGAVPKKFEFGEVFTLNEPCDDCDGSGEIEGDDADREIDVLDMIGLDPWGRER